MNVARMKAPLASELMASFVARVDEINGLADCSPGFIWRVKSTSGGAALLVPYDDERILVKFEGVYSVLWWIPAGHIPTIEEAKERLAHLQTHGPSAHAFGFKTIHQPDEAQV